MKLKRVINKLKKIADELSSLKKAYADDKESKRSLKRLLSQKVLKDSSISAKYTKSSVEIKSNSMDKKALDYLMGKLLNSTYDVRKINIKRLSEQKVSLELEIKW